MFLLEMISPLLCSIKLLTVALKHKLINEKVKIAAEEEKSESIFNFLSCMLVSKWPSQKPLQH